MTKRYRHKIISEIIKDENITSQNILLEKLIERGFELTQATLSRDIKELKLVKAPTNNGEYTYQFPESISPIQEDITTSSAFKFLNIEFSGQLAVVKTRPGYAMAIAGEIDREVGKTTILGTVAGDDTILLIPREDVTRDQILDSLTNFIPNHLL